MSTTKWDGLTGKARQLLPRLREAYDGGPRELKKLLVCSRFTFLEFHLQDFLLSQEFTLQGLLYTADFQLREHLSEEEIFKIKWALGEMGLGLGWPQPAIDEFGQRLTNA